MDDNTIKGTALEQWAELILAAGEASGRTLRIVDQTKELMEAAGFVNVTYKTYEWPMGPCAKDTKLEQLGLSNRLSWFGAVDGLLMLLFTKHHGVSSVPAMRSYCR